MMLPRCRVLTMTSSVRGLLEPLPMVAASRPTRRIRVQIEIGFGATAKAVKQRTNTAAFYQLKSVLVVEGRHEHGASTENLLFSACLKAEDDHEAEAFVLLSTDEATSMLLSS